MNKIGFLLLIISVLVVSGCKGKKSNTQMQSPNTDIKLVKMWSTSGGLKVPESVMFDKKRNVLYVSNINGKPTEKNSRGFISKLDLSGNIKKLRWITGLHAPRGMGIFKDVLYVTDIDHLVAIDIKLSKIKRKYPVKGALFLNDIAIDASGNVYLTDMSTNTIHVLKNSKIALFKKMQANLRTNGLYLHKNQLFVGTAKGILQVDIKNAEVIIAAKGSFRIDGIKMYTAGHFFVTDWSGRTRLMAKTQTILLLDTTAQKVNAADFEYIAENKMIILPTFFNNQVIAYKITDK